MGMEELAGWRIKAFDSFEEAQAFEQRQQERALQLIKPFQRALLDGKQHYWLRLVVYSPRDEQILLIAGWTYDLEKLEADLMARYGSDEQSRKEVAAENLERRSMLERGYALTKAHSEVEPDGEVGDTHAAVMLPITKKEFEAFQAVNFSLSAALADATLRPLVILWTERVGVQ